MDHKPDTFDLDRMVEIVRRRWRIIALLTVLITLGAFLLSVAQSKRYTATASVLFENQQVNQLQASGLQDTPSSASQDPQMMATNVQLLAQESGVSQSTAQIVGHGLTPSDVAGAIAVSQQGQTNIANVAATASDPSLAAGIANTFVNQFIAGQQRQQRAAILQGLKLVERQIHALSPQQIAGASGQALLDRAESLRVLARLQGGNVQLITPAEPPSSPSSPKVLRNTGLGLLLGLLVGLGVALLVERLDRRIRTVDELEATYRLPVLAAIPYSKSYAIPPQLNSPNGRAEAEVFRLLRAYLRYFNVDRELRTLLVGSAAPADGKTTVSYNLAEAAQETGTRTLLIEADLRRPNVANHYGLPGGPGLAEVLVGTAALRDAIQSVPVAVRMNGRSTEVTLDILVAGHPPPNPAELLESQAMSRFLQQAAEEYELVVIDTPPLAVVSDAMPLLRQVDGVVLVSRLNRHTRAAAAVLRDRLAGVDAPVLGVVANGATAKTKDAYGYGYGYYTSGNGVKSPKTRMFSR
jgi:tyrosine-protein kinase